MKKFTSVIIALLLVVSASAETLTVAQAIEIGQALANKTISTETYTFEGYVNVIDENSFNTSYNNMTFWIADTRGNAASTASGALQCYRCRPDRELQIGDKVRVEAPLKRFFETVETGQANSPVTWLESAPDEPEPEIVTGSLRVCAQNLKNYYFNPNTGRGNYTQEEIAAKTHKIVNAMLDIDADIFAFCEVEAKPVVLQQLADSMSAQAGVAGRYVAVSDDIDEDWNETYDNNIKSGFIYRTDKVTTVGSNAGAVGYGYYAHTMRIQAFRQLSDGERLVISMNHFKAKDSSADQGESQRQTNASNLLSALSQVNADPDILILGDLNCQVGETPVTMLVDAGYEEQLLKYNSSAWSHCFNGGELIDHVLANTTMASQIVNAYVKHVSASACNIAVNSWDSWSDHDPYVVEINLNTETPDDPCEDIDATYLTNGLAPMTSVNNIWFWYSNDQYGSYAKASKQGGFSDYMLTPVLNMNGMDSASISFQHTHKFAGTPSEELTLWVTPDFQGDFESSTWYQLTIDPYAANTNWTFVDVAIDVPTEYIGANTVFAFKYMSATDHYATWEIKNLHITAQCADSATDIENINDQKQTYKILRHGQLIIIRSGVEYTVTGQRVR